MLPKGFNYIIDIWINELEKYDFNLLCIKPTPTYWSLGQVYFHLIQETKFFFEQVNVCLSNTNHQTEQKSDAAGVIFSNYDFPDEQIVGPPSNDKTPQPENKQQLLNGLLDLKDEIITLEILIEKSLFNGKTRHPGLNFFNAREWFMFAEIHFRHHLRQKKRIDDYLKTLNK
ncbi:MAG: DinB family protein [Saprospiraceae bacterium]|nr:DinB family protein [Saprospiraceae bacterium]